MKKNLLLVSSIILTNLSYLLAQTTPATATWSLLTTQAGVTSGNVTVTNQTLGSAIAGTSYGTVFGAGVGGTGSGSLHNQNFQRAGSTTYLPTIGTGVADTVVTPNAYVEYKVSPAASTYLQINKISLATVGGGSGAVRLVAKYSLDDFATSAYVASTSNMATYNSTSYNASPIATSYAATQSNPVILLNGASSAADFNGSEILTFDNLAINVLPTQSFTLRLYAYVAATSGTRYLAEKDVVITGKTAATLAALPLDFLSFNAKLIDGLSKQVKLSWSTTNEVNTQSFSIERKNAGDFVSIGTIASNNTSGINNYSFTDLSPASGVNYYRLKQIDKDGKSSDSKIVQIENKGAISFSVYPNPTSGNSVTVLHDAAGDNATLKILNLQGQQIALTNISSGSTRSVLDISALASGYYVVSFLNGSEKSSIKFVKQ